MGPWLIGRPGSAVFADPLWGHYAWIASQDPQFAAELSKPAIRMTLPKGGQTTGGQFEMHQGKLRELPWTQIMDPWGETSAVNVYRSGSSTWYSGPSSFEPPYIYGALAESGNFLTINLYELGTIKSGDSEPVLADLIDLNGDGLLDRVIVEDPRSVISETGVAHDSTKTIVGSDPNIYSKSWAVYFQKPAGGLLNRVTNSIGGVTEIDYQNSIDIAVCTESLELPNGTTSLPPIIDTCGESIPSTASNLGSGYPVVKSVTTKDGRGQLRISDHREHPFRFNVNSHFARS